MLTSSELRDIHGSGLPWSYDDGGRAEAGFKGTAGDCVTRAIAVATGIAYKTVYDELAQGMKALWSYRAEREKNPARVERYRKRAVVSARNGVSDPVWKKFLKARGWVEIKLPRDSRLSDLPTSQMIIVRLRKHLVAVDRGVLLDTYDSSYGYDRLAFHYWTWVG